MKKLSLFLLFTCATIGIAMADNPGKPVNASEIPSTAAMFIKSNFPSAEIVMAKVYNKPYGTNYKVTLNEGTKIKFDKKGDWKKVENKKGIGIPTTVIPSPIIEYLNRTQANVPVTSIERDSKEYEVELENDVEITFDTRFRVTDFDD